jgi:magnesium transporter
MARALSSGEVALADWWRVVLRELPSALGLGLWLGALTLAGIDLWQHLRWSGVGGVDTIVTLAIALSVAVVVAVGSLVGATLPFALRAVRLSPAAASAPVVTTVVDLAGLAVYVAIALAMLRVVPR